MSAWTRIDLTHRLRNPEPSEGTRTYGADGGIWPRLTLTVEIEKYLRTDDGPEFGVRCATKECGGAWWETRRGIPMELLPEVVEMLGELTATTSTP